MPNAAESARAKAPLASALASGVDTISSNQIVRFTKYVRAVLPLDGYVFWLNAATPDDNGAVFGESTIGTFVWGGSDDLPVTLDISGSLHYATDTRQGEDETYDVNRVVFTAKAPVDEFNVQNSDVLYIGMFDGLQFAWSTRKSFYRQADLYHYVGDAVYADMRPQVVDDAATLQIDDVIVSNSLPVWLSLNAWVTPIYLPFARPAFTLYPSFLVPDDISPPFASVHILPDATRAIGGVPVMGSTLSHSQLAADRVRITLWGVRNDAALSFMDFVNQFSLSTDLIGLMNIPIVQDLKRTQSELSTIAQKKVIEFDVSYNQAAVRDVARKLVTAASCIVTST